MLMVLTSRSVMLQSLSRYRFIQRSRSDNQCCDNIRFLASIAHHPFNHPCIQTPIHSNTMSLIFEFALLGLFMFGLFATFRFLVRRASGNRFFKYGMALTLLAAFLLFWVNGAVGIIGSENNDANMLYLGVVLIVFGGIVLVRFTALKMKRVALAAACAMVMIAVVALATGLGVSGPIWPWDVVWITAFFSGMWFLASWFFNKAEQSPSREISPEADSITQAREAL